jgi:hypothetical protein
MFGSKKEAKQDLRRGMWEAGPVEQVDIDVERSARQSDFDIASPDLRPQAEGQTTHE